jgi:creatinine amidohydrolase
MHLAELTWPAVQALDKRTPVVIPVAALEQHGHHLPLYTDSMLLEEVIRRASRTLEREALFVPLMWLGQSCHHLEFAGSLSAGTRTYLDLLGTFIDNFVTHGFQRIMFLNGHGGNVIPGRHAVCEARQRYRQRDDLLLLFGNYWGLADKKRQMPAIFQQTDLGHACEWETSMILRIAPHLVGKFDDLEDVPRGFPFEPAYQGWISRDRTTKGHMGAPRHASPEKGEILLRMFAEDVANFVKRVYAWDGKSWDV